MSADLFPSTQSPALCLCWEGSSGGERALSASERCEVLCVLHISLKTPQYEIRVHLRRQFSSSAPRTAALLTQSCGSFIQPLYASKQNLMQNKELQTLCYRSLALSPGRIALQASSANKVCVPHLHRKAAGRHQLQWSQHKFPQRVTAFLLITPDVSLSLGS